jgi:hypothetical protein
VELARINAEHQVMGTFFILLRGHAYNPASTRSQQRIRELLGLGQRVAFHWSAPPDLAPEREALARCVLRDFELATAIIPGLEPAFAVHSASPTLLRRCLELECPPLVNVNGPRFCRRMPYFGDSNLRYSVETWRAILRRRESPVHVLLHPVNWIAGGADMGEVLRNAWPYLLAEAEEELRLNRIWTSAFPSGLPEEAALAFSEALVDSAGSA